MGVFVDGTFLSIPRGKTAKEPLYVALGIKPDGRRGRSWGFGFSTLPLHHQPTGTACQGGEEAAEKPLYLVLSELDEVWGARRLQRICGNPDGTRWEATMLTGHTKCYTMFLSHFQPSPFEKQSSRGVDYGAPLALSEFKKTGRI